MPIDPSPKPVLTGCPETLRVIDRYDACRIPGRRRVGAILPVVADRGHQVFGVDVVIRGAAGTIALHAVACAGAAR